MRRGFTLIEILLATIILGLGLVGILTSMSQAQRLMLYSNYYQTAQEVMDIGDMAYPLEDIKDPMMDIDIDPERATTLWNKISDERLTNEQEKRFHGYTWEREWLNKNDDEEIERLGGLYIIKVTVRWGNDRRGNEESDSYITFWRKSE